MLSHRSRSFCGRFTATLLAGTLAGHLPACVYEEDPPAAPPMRGTVTQELTDIERELAALLDVHVRLGADEDCTPALYSDIGGGITHLTAAYGSRPNLDDLALSPESLTLTAYVNGGEVMSCTFSRTSGDDSDIYDGWRGVLGLPGELFDPPCDVLWSFDPPPGAPWDMLEAYVDGPEMVACTGDPPPPPPPDDGGGDDDGGDDGGGSDAVAFLTGGANSSGELDARLFAEALRSPEVARMRREIPAVLREVQASGSYRHLSPVARTRAEMKAVMDIVQPSADAAELPAGGTAGARAVPTSPTCVPCAGYALIVIGELIFTISYMAQVAKAPPGAKAEKWAVAIAAWIAVAGTSIVALHYCVSCPPVAPLLFYIGNLLLDLVALTLVAAICVISAIMRNPVCPR